MDRQVVGVAVAAQDHVARATMPNAQVFTAIEDRLPRRIVVDSLLHDEDHDRLSIDAASPLLA
jgi:hypothetical protein